MARRPLFTVFTPTWNRAHTLPRVYESLRAQTLRDFEWLIVDDGSTDGTDDLVARWQREAAFPIRYVRQENRGKPAAVNRGLAEARGELFLVFDSDDACVPDALERFHAIWESIPAERREAFSGVTVHCLDPAGAIVGNRFPRDPLDEHPHRVRTRYGVTGEKWGFHRTDLLRQHRYPDFPGERFVPDTLLWNRMSRDYLVRHVNVGLRLYHPDTGGLAAGLRRLRMESPNGAAEHYREELELDLPIRAAVRTAVNYVRYARHAGRSVARIVREAARPLTVLIALPAGMLAAALDRRAVR